MKDKNPPQENHHSEHGGVYSGLRLAGPAAVHLGFAWDHESLVERIAADVSDLIGVGDATLVADER